MLHLGLPRSEHSPGFALQAGTCGENESEPKWVKKTGK